MNIFYLDKNPTTCANMMHDKHVVKMILETGQLLSACRVHYNSTCPIAYPKSVPNHPCAKWVMESKHHYIWLAKHYLALCYEYHRRYNKLHARHDDYQTYKVVPAAMPDARWIDPPRCMPLEYDDGDAISSYRRYYNAEKLWWTRGNDGRRFKNTWTFPAVKPDWIKK